MDDELGKRFLPIPDGIEAILPDDVDRARLRERELEEIRRRQQHGNLNIPQSFAEVITRSDRAHDYLVWVDVEHAGQDAGKNILEIAVVITNNTGHECHAISRVVHWSESELQSISEWCRKQYAKPDNESPSSAPPSEDLPDQYPQRSSLLQEVLDSKLSVDQVDQDLFDFLESHAAPNRPLFMAGMNVHCDYVICKRELPKFISRISIDLFDLKTIQMVSRWFYPDFHEHRGRPRLDGRYSHRALYDIRRSLDLYRFYMLTIFANRTRGAEPDTSFLPGDVLSHIRNMSITGATKDSLPSMDESSRYSSSSRKFQHQQPPPIRNRHPLPACFPNRGMGHPYTQQHQQYHQQQPPPPPTEFVYGYVAYGMMFPPHPPPSGMTEMHFPRLGAAAAAPPPPSTDVHRLQTSMSEGVEQSDIYPVPAAHHTVFATHRNL